MVLKAYQMIKIRGQDRHGAGHYRAPRKGRRHSGIDIIIHKNEAVIAYEGGEVSKIGYPYNPEDTKKGHLRYVQVTTDSGDRFRYFYVGPLVNVGDTVGRGDIIGSAQGLAEIYKGITEHIHLEIMKPGRGKSFYDPVPILEGLGYEFLG